MSPPLVIHHKRTQDQRTPTRGKFGMQWRYCSRDQGVPHVLEEGIRVALFFDKARSGIPYSHSPHSVSQWSGVHGSVLAAVLVIGH